MEKDHFLSLPNKIYFMAYFSFIFLFFSFIFSSFFCNRSFLNFFILFRAFLDVLLLNLGAVVGFDTFFWIFLFRMFFLNTFSRLYSASKASKPVSIIDVFHLSKRVLNKTEFFLSGFSIFSFFLLSYNSFLNFLLLLNVFCSGNP